MPRPRPVTGALTGVEDLDGGGSGGPCVLTGVEVVGVLTGVLTGVEDLDGGGSGGPFGLLSSFFSCAAAASLAACEGPVIKSIPYVVQPTEIIPGVANYYATTIADGYDFASVLIKTREGRPIKVENNTDASTNGMANARVNASILGLYDNLRVKAPMKGDTQISWSAFMSETTSAFNNLEDGKEIVFLTQTFASPSTKKLVGEFAEKYGNVRHVVYDAISESATLDAYEAKYGVRGMANYDFSKAKTIVSIGADFIGDWQGGGFESGYAKGRVPDHGKMSRHIQFESNMSLAGANADKRVPLKPSEQN